jgi:hypothetical protein
VDVASGEARRGYTTDDEPGGVLRVRCHNRRETACPSCSALYKGDARRIVREGLAAGPGMPAVFVTLTAPSFGPVHSRRDRHGPGRVCRQRAGLCVHGVRLGCAERHSTDDPRLGEPLCWRCYDYAGLVVWNTMSTLLWKRTVAALRRALARHAGSLAALRRTVRVDAVRVAEAQGRGAVHFHAVVRLVPLDDAAGLPGWATVATLSAELHTVVPGVALDVPTLPELAPADGRLLFEDAAVPATAGGVRWGRQFDVVPLVVDQGDDVRRVANYLAKYVTKSVGQGGALDRPLYGLGDLARTRLRPHAVRIVETCWELGSRPGFAAALDGAAERGGKRAGLLRWAHQYGYGGHWLAKSRGSYQTFRALRAIRREHARREQHPDGMPPDEFGRDDGDPRTEIVGVWRYAGRGFHTEFERMAGELLAGVLNVPATGYGGDGPPGPFPRRDSHGGGER